MKKALLAVLTALLLLACATAVACAGAQNVALDPGSAPQTIYVLGSDLNLDKGALVVDGETVPLNADGVEITGYDKDKLGQQTLTVTYKGKSTQLIVNVVPAFQAAEKYVYFLGETLEDAHPRFIVTATDGTQTPVNIGDAGLTVTGFDSSQSRPKRSRSTPPIRQTGRMLRERSMFLCVSRRSASVSRPNMNTATMKQNST